MQVGLERDMSKAAMRLFGIRANALRARVLELSGGNQQKVVLARCMSLRPKVIVLSDPTRGVDVGAKAEIYRVINEMAANGTAIVLISSELPELLGMSDRIIVMFQGSVCAELARSEATEEKLTHAAMGGRDDD